MDSIEQDTAFAKELELDYPILSDASKSVAKAYGVLAPGKEYASRWTFIIGKDGKVLDVLSNVHPSTHGKDLAERLASLGVARKEGASAAASASASASAPEKATAAPSSGARPSSPRH